MREGRLFGIVYYLLAHGRATAPELARRFEVSVRTVYRDLDALISAGVPICTAPGKGGGVSLLERYTLDKALLTGPEREQLLAALQGLLAATGSRADGLLNKLSGAFGLPAAPWLEVDLSDWRRGQPQPDTFALLKGAILQRHVVAFCYYSGGGAGQSRTARPLRLVFKSRDWYLYAFCLRKRAYRFFKLTRIRGLAVLPETFAPDAAPVPRAQPPAERTVAVTLRFDREMAFRVYDEFASGVTQDAQGNLYVQTELPDGAALYAYVLSFAEHAEVLAPPRIRAQMQQRLQKMQARYQTCPPASGSM